MHETNGHTISTRTKKFFSIYLDTISSTELQLSATPKLITSYFTKNDKILQIAGCRRIQVQPTAISRRREGAPRGRIMASSGRPVKRLHPEPDCAVQNKRGKKNNINRRQNLRRNELKNQANHFKQGRGH